MLKLGIFTAFLILGFFLGFILDEKFFSARVMVKSGPQVEGAQVKSLITMVTPTPDPTPTPARIATQSVAGGPTPTPTPTPKPTPVINAPSNLEELFSHYSSAYSINKELLKRIAYCESRFNPNAQTKDYAGLFQFSEGLWVSTRNLMGENADINLRLDAKEAIKTAAFMISQGHLNKWPKCGK